MEPTHIALIISGALAILGGFWAVFKAFGTFYMKSINTRLDKQDKMLEENQKSITAILTQVSALTAGRVGFMTTDQCAINNKAFEAKYDAKIANAKTEVLEEVEAVEYRLTKQIDEIKQKVA